MPSAEEFLQRIRDRRVASLTPEEIAAREAEQAKKDRYAKFTSMVDLAETDLGMKGLLDRAEAYYVLKNIPEKTAKDRLEDILKALSGI